MSTSRITRRGTRLPWRRSTIASAMDPDYGSAARLWARRASRDLEPFPGPGGLPGAQGLVILLGVDVGEGLGVHFRGLRKVTADHFARAGVALHREQLVEQHAGEQDRMRGPAVVNGHDQR